jgi:hypothetical protein
VKSEAEIKSRMDELRRERDERNKRRANHARRVDSGRSTLGIRRIRETEGELKALSWVLERS